MRLSTMKRLPLVLILAFCTALPSCFSYHAHFRKAVAASAGKHEDPTGPWIGEWKSDFNGHDGPLWCIVTESKDEAGAYDFRYRAGWGIFKFGNYVHTVKVNKTPEGHFLLKGDMDLPKLVGNHSVDGKITKDAFTAKFKSTKGDHGTMTLKRPPFAAPKEEKEEAKKAPAKE